MLETDLRTYLLSHDSLKSYISNRIYPGWIPENATMPCVAYLNVSGVRFHDIPVGFPRYQFSIFSKGYIEAKSIANEMRDILQRFKGDMGESKIIQIVFENEYENYENDTKLYHVTIDFKIILWE